MPAGILPAGPAPLLLLHHLSIFFLTFTLLSAAAAAHDDRHLFSALTEIFLFNIGGLW